MRRLICHLSCCLLALALLTNHPAVAASAPAKDSKDPKGTEAVKDTQQKGSEESKTVGESKEPKKPAGPKPALHTVKKEPFKIEVSLDGVFETQKMTEIVLRPKAWSTMTVLKAVEHGTEVKPGDLLVSLDLEKIDRAIADLRRERQTSDLSMKLAEQQLQMLEKTTPMDLAASQRTQKMAREDLDYYLRVSRPQAIKFADFMLKSSQQQLEYEEEELRQLEKMYKADDLTEETEEIILKRARNAVEEAKFFLEDSEVYHDRVLKTTIPRRDVSIKESAKRIDLQSKGTRVTLPITLKKRRLELDKIKVARTRSEERLKHLLADRAAMTVKAPVAGVVYYGKCVRGKFSAGLTSALRRGSSLAAKQVFMTIVKPRPMFIRTSVVEKQLHNVRAGIKGTAVPTGYPEMKLTAIVQRVAAVPRGSTFDSRITVALDDKAEALMPGMTCKVKLVSYQKKAAVTVPPKCLMTDEVDEERQYVYLVDKKGKHKKRYVTAGKRTAAKVEILKGLSEGDQLLLARPKEEGKPPKKKKKPPKKEKEPPKEKKEPPKEKDPPKEKKVPPEEKDPPKEKKVPPEEKK